MRRKHRGAVGLAVLGAALIASLAYGATALFGGGYVSVGRLPEMPQGPVLSVNSLIEMDYLEQSMAALSRPAEEAAEPLNFGLLGFAEPADYAASASTGYTDSHRDVVLNYEITMAFTSGATRFCRINGELYQQGAELPDGAKIIEIRPTQVLIAKRGVRQWVPVVSWHLGGRASGSRSGASAAAGSTASSGEGLTPTEADLLGGMQN